MNSEQVRRNTEFLKRFRRSPRMKMPDYIAHQKNEGKLLEHEPARPKKGSGKTVSLRARLAKTVQFSRDLKSVSTERQLRVYALMVADQAIAQRRRAEKAL